MENPNKEIKPEDVGITAESKEKAAAERRKKREELEAKVAAWKKKQGKTEAQVAFEEMSPDARGDIFNEVLSELEAKGVSGEKNILEALMDEMGKTKSVDEAKVNVIAKFTPEEGDVERAKGKSEEKIMAETGKVSTWDNFKNAVKKMNPFS